MEKSGAEHTGKDGGREVHKVATMIFLELKCLALAFA